jgi:hypothetical protein
LNSPFGCGCMRFVGGNVVTVFINQAKFGNQLIPAFGTYLPWSLHQAVGGDKSNYPEYSGRILDLKSGYPAAVTYFHPIIDPELLDEIAISVVPGHDPSKAAGGLAALADALTQNNLRINASSCLFRNQKIAKLAHGGDRSLDIHRQTVAVREKHLIQGQDVLLLDDVTKTGNSLIACRQHLLDAGARSVQCVAIGKV